VALFCAEAGKVLNRKEAPRKAMRTQIFINGLLRNLKQGCGAQSSYSYLAGRVKRRPGSTALDLSLMALLVVMLPANVSAE
jgi:hypothetical protein